MAARNDPYNAGGMYGDSPVRPRIIGMSVASAMAVPSAAPATVTSRASQWIMPMTWRRVEPTSRSMVSSPRRSRTVITSVLTAATAANPPRTAAMTVLAQAFSSRSRLCAVA